MRQIQIIGIGCAKCERLAAHTRAAAEALGIRYQLRKVADIQSMLALGIMTTPALVVDGQVKVVGRVPSTAEIKGLLA